MPSKKPEVHKPNLFERLLLRIDAFQQRHRFLGFPYAVVKKFGDDDAGHQAALITYYGFLSLFPLLIVATSAIDIVTKHNPVLRDKLLSNVQSFFPAVGQQLQASVQGNNKTGLALAIGLLIALYGARGVADAIRSALDHAWAIPRVRRSGFPKNTLKSLGLLLGAGLGLLLTTTLTGYASSALGNSAWLRVLPLILNIGLLYLVFMYVFLIGTSHKYPRKDLRMGAITAALGLLILQYAGIALVKHQLSSLQGLYGQFAIVLALMFWIYLQAQVFIYAVEINVVHTYKLWPRSLTQKPITGADEKAFRLYAQKEAYRPKYEEQIDVTFRRTK